MTPRRPSSRGASCPSFRLRASCRRPLSRCRRASRTRARSCLPRPGRSTTCAARVPKLTVVLRKAYGGAYITMNSKGLGADLVFAWPQAELGIMAAKQAVGVIHRRESEERRAELADEYAAEHLGAESAARDGF